MNIVTSICVDEDEKDKDVIYPATLGASSDQRKIIYWKCVAVFFATSVRCNPTAKHILYTNDKHPVIFRGLDLKQFLVDLGVDIRIVPFKHFKPPVGFSKVFKNAFYKLDVMRELGMGEENEYSVLLDSDCVWTKPNNDIEEMLKSSDVLLYDMYKSYQSTKGKFYNVRVKLGELYKEINPGYPKVEPTQFGGEFVAAKNKNFKVMADLMYEAFTLIISNFKDKSLKLDDGRRLFDGMEFLTSYVYNSMPLRYFNAKDFISRIWTALKFSNTSIEDVRLTVWHMPSEKTQGFPLLYQNIINKNSKFWQVPLADFNIYLGKYLGVPRQYTPQRYLMLSEKIFEAIKRKIMK